MDVLVHDALSSDQTLIEVPMNDDVTVNLDLSAYELLWPTAMFAAEGERILCVTHSL